MANDLFIDSATLTMKVKASSGLVQADQTLHLMLNGQPMGFLPLEEGEQEHEYVRNPENCDVDQCKLA